MGYNYWPSGVAPYLAYTYVTDRVTPLNHQAIMDGLARDVGWIQHNVNTTNLFASGYARPIESGYFKNINTDFLYVKDLQARSVALYNVQDPRISTLDIVGTDIVTRDTAFRNNNITVSDTFRGTNFSLNVSGLMYNPIFISGGLYDYYLQQAGSYRFLQGLFSSVTIVSGNFVVDPQHRIIFENIGGFAPTGSINESAIFWNPIDGHNHIDNKVSAADIIDAAVTYNNDLIIEAKDGSIDVISGILDADFYNQELSYESVGFYELDYAGSGRYTCNTPALSGWVKDLEIGTGPIISYGGKVYATSKEPPSGSTNWTDAYIYSTEDFCNWTGAIVSGAWRPQVVSGVSTVDAFAVNANTLYYMMNLKVTSGNYCSVGDVTTLSTSGIVYYLNQYAHGSSRYGLGLGSIENILFVYGYEFPHIYESGIPKWDRNCLFYSGGNQTVSTYATGQDLCYSGVPYRYSFPFIQGFLPSTTEQYFWLDGTYDGREPFLTDSVNSGVLMMARPDLGFSGYFGAFFGNGFSEITAMLSSDLSYHNGQRGIYQQIGFYEIEHVLHSDLVENYSEAPVLVFGNSTVCVDTVVGSSIFGGCVPLVMDVDKRILPSVSGHVFITSGNAEFAPMFQHGARSLVDDKLLFRMPAYWYNPASIAGIMNSNLFQDWPVGSGRLWTDYSWVNFQRTELINMTPWEPGSLVTPFGGSGQVSYKHSTESNPVKLVYDSMLTNSNGLIIPSGTFPDHRNYPTYYDRPILDGFWRDKSFDWWYVAPTLMEPSPPSGAYPKTYYYMRPKCPIQHNGIIYCILEYNTGFIYIGPNGSEYVDDSILYSDLIKYGNTVYGVGSKNDNLILTVIKRNTSTAIRLPSSMSGTELTPKFLIHRGLLYVGIGNGRFLVKKPAHTDLCITTNL